MSNTPRPEGEALGRESTPTESPCKQFETLSFKKTLQNMTFGCAVTMETIPDFGEKYDFTQSTLTHRFTLTCV